MRSSSTGTPTGNACGAACRMRSSIACCEGASNALEPFGDDAGPDGRRHDVVDGDDVRVVDAARRARFLLEARELLLVMHARIEEFDGYRAAELLIVRRENMTHPALTEHAIDAVT